ncbi:MAG: hypothetical protein OXG38_01265 [Chloroflexi bacterium]|nr:hypothetical protein [Chloroflexota bacterium]
MARYNAAADESARLQAVLADALDDEGDKDEPPAGARGQAPLASLIDNDDA